MNKLKQALNWVFDLFRTTETLIPVLREYFAHKAKGLSTSTIEKHGYFFDNIEVFLQANKLQKLQLHQVRHRHMEQLRQWLFQTRNSSIEHASRHIEHIRSAFDYAVMMEYIPYNRLAAVKGQREQPGNPVSLEPKEVKKMYNAEFANSTWQLVLDAAMFYCFTGINYMDLWLYRIEVEEGVEFVTSVNGRGKNGKAYSAQFNKYAKRLHKKYKGQWPHFTVTTFNSNIKKIARALNIQKELSSSTFRKTYTTLRYDQGMSLEAISDEVGNTPDILRKHYITKSRKRVIREIDELGDRPLLAG